MYPLDELAGEESAMSELAGEELSKASRLHIAGHCLPHPLFYAGLVKLLRRCLSQLNTRTRTFIDAASKYERDVQFQVNHEELL